MVAEAQDQEGLVGIVPLQSFDEFSIVLRGHGLPADEFVVSAVLPGGFQSGVNSGR